MTALFSIELVATIGAVALVGGGFALGQVVSEAKQPATRHKRPPRTTRSWWGQLWLRWADAKTKRSGGEREFETSQHEQLLWRARQDIKRMEKTIVALEAERDDYREQAVEARAAVEAIVAMNHAQRAA